MRTIVYLIIWAVITPELSAQNQPFKDSLVEQNLFMRIYYPSAIPLDNSAQGPITACIMTHTNETEIIHFPKPEYFCRLNLLNSNNIPIAKTKDGQEYGNLFAALTNFFPGAIGTNGRNTGGSRRPDIGTAHTRSGTGHELPPLQKLFAIKDPGQYKLSLQFQVFKVVGAPPAYSHELVILPPVEIDLTIR